MEPVLATRQWQAQEQRPQQLTGFILADMMIPDLHPVQVALPELFGIAQLSLVKQCNVKATQLRHMLLALILFYSLTSGVLCEPSCVLTRLLLFPPSFYL